MIALLVKNRLPIVQQCKTEIRNGHIALLAYHFLLVKNQDFLITGAFFYSPNHKITSRIKLFLQIWDKFVNQIQVRLMQIK